MTTNGGTPAPAGQPIIWTVPEAGRRGGASRAATGLRILVVDDEPAVRNSIGRLLARQGFQVETVPTGAAAMARMRSHPFDAVITDMGMPGLSGAQLHELVCGEFPELAHRMIFTSGDLTPTETQAFLQQSGCPSLEKPYGLAELVAVLREFCPAVELGR